MSYQLQRDETLGKGLQRICRKQIELALAIVKGETEAEDTPVHDTRKHLKKGRAVLQLVKNEIGRGLFKKQDHCLRDVGRLIAEIRDAEVRLQTARELRNIIARQKRRSYRKVEETLALELESFIAAFAEWQVQAVPMLEHVLDVIDHWPVDQISFKQLRRRVQVTYKHGRNTLADAKRTSTAECFHLFRIEATRLWYELRVLAPTNPVVLKNLTDDLRALGELLGRAHDLSFLSDRLRQDFDGKRSRDGEQQELLAVIEASQSDLQRGAADLAEHFYAERPRDFGARIGSWLDEWSAAESPSVADALVSSSATLASGRA